ncbi:MAG: glycosyltransferase [Acidobacteria bacterium]|nr:glycosyltransferase [Acidobacteriota bacterium]
MASLPAFLAAPTPRTLWVELTSKCPFDCIFCSRQARRGVGVHLPFTVYTSLLNALMDPRRLILNYSGESTLYPELIPAIQETRATGALVELVSVLATAPESLLGPLSRSGLNRLTVSVHATDPEKFADVYRYSSFATLRSRLERFVELCRTAPQPPAVDLAFVAMDTNLTQLSSVASLASTLALREVMIFPVMRRDEIPAQFASELKPDGVHRHEFETRVRAVLNQTEQDHPDIRITICNESFTAVGRQLGEVPVPWPWELPEGALIYSCEQNPWETAHVLSNGDVVACEVLDKKPLGNLFERSIEEIWHGESYRRFRERYRLGEIPECRTCPWKRAYRPAPPASEIVAARGMNAQLLHGWHEPSGEGHIWSSQQAAAVLAPHTGSRTLHVSGMLPPGPESNPNQLIIWLNGAEMGRVTNPWAEIMPFGLDFGVAADEKAPWILEFRTTHVFRPSERGAGADQRDLGFALVLLVSKALVDAERAAARKALLQPLRHFVASIDLWGTRMRRRWRRMPAASAGAWKPGLSIVIPEWDNREELAGCLASVRKATDQWSEPLQVIVVVNGSPKSAYHDLRREHPQPDWRFYDRPLGFARAIRAGLQSVRYDWVYLLNSDVVLEPSALRVLARECSSGVFSVASQILLKDTTRFRDETNWTTLIVEFGLATIHDRIPETDVPIPTFYSGGGASLFRACLLRELLDASAYDPFYWEDVEWGWRARKSGYDSWFCPGSIAYHTRRSTIGRHYPPEMVESIVRRNGLLFQLRNFTTAGSLERVMEEIARAPEPVGAYFLKRATRWKIARGRLWNHLAPFTDEEVFDRWNSSISNS